MDTLEAKKIILELWPTSFRAEHWRTQLEEELDTWDGLERRHVIEKLKGTHNGKRVSLETLRQARGGVGKKSLGSGGNLADRERVTEEWVAEEGLTDAYNRAAYGDRLMIGRLVWSMLNEPDWKDRLARQSGSSRYWQGWERIENLLNAASKANIDGHLVCWPTKRAEDASWKPRLGSARVSLPPLPVWFSDAERLSGLKQITDIAKKFGGMKVGNYGGIFSSAEYQAYLADFEQRYRAAFERQHGAPRNSSELQPPATRPLDVDVEILPPIDGWKRPSRRVPESSPSDDSANQPQSPLTGSSDFDGLGDGRD